MKIFALLTLLLLCVGTAAATDLRGRVDSRNPYNGAVYARSGAEVVLFAWNGSAWVPAVTTTSGTDGMYYMQQVAPGQYQLRINGLWFPLAVANQPSQDVPAVVVP